MGKDATMMNEDVKLFKCSRQNMYVWSSHVKMSKLSNSMSWHAHIKWVKMVICKGKIYILVFALVQSDNNKCNMELIWLISNLWNEFWKG